MSNATDNLIPETAGDSGAMVVYLPVAATTHIYKGTLVAQNASGYVLPYSATGALYAIGVAQHEQNNTGSNGAARVAVETHRVYVFANGTSGDAFSDLSLIGAPAYATDDHTVADNSNGATRKCVGFFMGFESDGKVRVLIDPRLASLINALATLTDGVASADTLRDNIVSQLG